MIRHPIEWFDIWLIIWRAVRRWLGLVIIELEYRWWGSIVIELVIMECRWWGWQNAFDMQHTGANTKNEETQIVAMGCHSGPGVLLVFQDKGGSPKWQNNDMLEIGQKSRHFPFPTNTNT